MVKGAVDIAERLDVCLGNVNPLLRDILTDFQAYLSKTLLGSHGQTLGNFKVKMAHNEKL
jgi:hypothetical protein